MTARKATNTKTITGGDFETEVLRSPEPVLVDFYTDGCGPCRDLVPVLEEIAQELAGRWKLVKVDAGAEVNLAARFRISAVPTLLVFRDGACVAQRTGKSNKQALLAWLAEV